MLYFRSVFVVLVTLLFTLGFAVPAKDLPETAYDESELLPVESAPAPSLTLAERSDQAAAVGGCDALFAFADSCPIVSTQRKAIPLETTSPSGTDQFAVKDTANHHIVEVRDLVAHSSCGRLQPELSPGKTKDVQFVPLA